MESKDTTKKIKYPDGIRPTYGNTIDPLLFSEAYKILEHTKLPNYSIIHAEGRLYICTDLFYLSIKVVNIDVIYYTVCAFGYKFNEENLEEILKRIEFIIKTHVIIVENNGCME